MRRTLNYLLIATSLVVASCAQPALNVVGAQTVKRVCPKPGVTLSMAKMQACADTLKAQLDSVLAADHQIRLSIADLYAKWQKHEDRLNAGGGGTGPTLSDGNLYVPGKLIVGDCIHKDSDAKLDVCSAGDGTIHVESGVGGPKPAVGMVGVGGDHGMRLAQNAYTSVNKTQKYDPVGKLYYMSGLIEGVDPNYPQSVIGADSQGRFSIQLKPSRASGLFDKHEYTQDFAFGFNEETKEITLESWRPGWKFVFVTSSGFRTIDQRFTAPTQ